MLALHSWYRPLTSRPFLAGPSYTEYAPCEALRPYIVCFWGTGGVDTRNGNANTPNAGVKDRKVLVIPDTCVDIIIEINYTKQKISSRLCGLSDYAMVVNQKRGAERIAEFAVRFHFWAASLFLDLNMSDVYNQTMDLEQLIPGCVNKFSPLFYMDTIRERIAWMENWLLGRLAEERLNQNLFNAIDRILKSSGRASVKEVCEYSCVSQRQMERLFKQEVGVSIKRAASLVRYQNVWRDVVSKERFEVQEAVYRYGYADQSHLLHEFKRFHSMTPEQAKKIALANR